jgi:hypothetical protein
MAASQESDDREPRNRGATPKRRRSFWFDPRFAIGLVLVVVSVLGVDALVTAAERLCRCACGSLDAHAG